MWMWDEVQLVMTRRKKEGKCKFPLVKQLLQLKPIDSDRTVMFYVNLTRFSSLSNLLSHPFGIIILLLFCFRSRLSKRIKLERISKLTLLANTGLFSSPFIKIIDYKTVLHLMTWLLNWFTHSILFLSFSSLSHLLTLSHSHFIHPVLKSQIKMRKEKMQGSGARFKMRHTLTNFFPTSFSSFLHSPIIFIHSASWFTLLVTFRILIR